MGGVVGSVCVGEGLGEGMVGEEEVCASVTSCGHPGWPGGQSAVPWHSTADHPAGWKVRGHGRRGACSEYYTLY